MENSVDIWYLGHSGFAVGIGKQLLIFDYYLNGSDSYERSLNTGVICPEEIEDKSVKVFVSHSHPDHFNPIILTWKNKLKDVKYFISSDIPKKYRHEWVNIVSPYHEYKNPDITIKTFKSTDEGVAFLINVMGISIYHAGDLNWWHWGEESKAWNNNMAASFKHEVNLIKENSIDVAFLTTDPRQEEYELLGITWFLENVDTKVAFPMHFWKDYSIMDRIEEKAKENALLRKVRPITRRGQHFTLSI